MKRDLKKWLKGAEVLELARLNETELESFNVCVELFKEISKGSDEDMERLVQTIWCAAQRQFLKDILDDIDDGIDKIFGKKDQVRDYNARIVAEESKLKSWLYGKYKYLQQKNGK